MNTMGIKYLSVDLLACNCFHGSASLNTWESGAQKRPFSFSFSSLTFRAVYEVDFYCIDLNQTNGLFSQPPAKGFHAQQKLWDDNHPAGPELLTWWMAGDFSVWFLNAYDFHFSLFRDSRGFSFSFFMYSRGFFSRDMCYRDISRVGRGHSRLGVFLWWAV